MKFNQKIILLNNNTEQNKTNPTEHLRNLGFTTGLIVVVCMTASYA